MTIIFTSFVPTTDTLNDKHPKWIKKNVIIDDRLMFIKPTTWKDMVGIELHFIDSITKAHYRLFTTQIVQCSNDQA